MVILGIDPGTKCVGFGIIKKIKRGKNKGKLKYLNSGVILTEKNLPPGERLKKLYNHLSFLIRKFSPKLIAVEKLYFFKNLKTVISVSEAKGVFLLLGAKKKIKVVEVTPLQVKLAIAGYGRASKKQIKKAIGKILNLEKEFKFDDEADALAIALCGSRYEDI